MSNAFSLSTEDAEPRHIQTWRTFSVRPTYPILLALVMIVGFASMMAWCFSDLSLEARAQRGEAKAQYLLGKQYFTRALSPRDYALAARLIRQSANQGYARAQTALGLLYEKGLGVPVSYADALDWFRLAADQGYSVAQNELGVMYAKGLGVPRNLQQAAKWCGLAAVQGSEIAKQNLELAELACRKVIPAVVTPAKHAYRHAIVQRVEPDGVTLSFVPEKGGFGIARVKFENLPAELQRMCKNTTKEGAAADSAYSHIGSMATPL